MYPPILCRKIQPSSLCICMSLGLIRGPSFRRIFTPAFTHDHRSEGVFVVTEMLYAIFQAWNVHTRGRRGCSFVIHRESSTAS